MQFPCKLFNLICELKCHQAFELVIYSLLILRLTDTGIHDGQVFNSFKNLLHRIIELVEASAHFLKVIGVKRTIIVMIDIDVGNKKVAIDFLCWYHQQELEFAHQVTAYEFISVLNLIIRLAKVGVIDVYDF